MPLPIFEELEEEKEYLLNIKEILEHLCEEDREQMNEIFPSIGIADWRRRKETKILYLLQSGKTIDDLSVHSPITLGLNRRNKLLINDGFTRIKVAHKVGIKKIKVIVAKAD